MTLNEDDIERLSKIIPIDSPDHPSNKDKINRLLQSAGIGMGILSYPINALADGVANQYYLNSGRTRENPSYFKDNSFEAIDYGLSNWNISNENQSTPTTSDPTTSDPTEQQKKAQGLNALNTQQAMNNTQAPWQKPTMNFNSTRAQRLTAPKLPQARPGHIGGLNEWTRKNNNRNLRIQLQRAMRTKGLPKERLRLMDALTANHMANYQNANANYNAHEDRRLQANNQQHLHNLGLNQFEQEAFNNQRKQQQTQVQAIAEQQAQAAKNKQNAELMATMYNPDAHDDTKRQAYSYYNLINNPNIKDRIIQSEQQIDVDPITQQPIMQKQSYDAGSPFGLQPLKGLTEDQIAKLYNKNAKNKITTN